MNKLLLSCLVSLPLTLLGQDSIPAWWIDARLSGFYADGVKKQKFFRDLDGDTFGDSLVFVIKYPGNKPNGYVIDSTDCDDNSMYRYPGAIELCNGVDDDCDGYLEQTGCNVISITSTGRLINKDLFSGCLEDVWFKGGENNMIDIFGDELFFPRLKAIGFTSLMYGNGSQAHAYMTDPDTARDGYNCVPYVQEGNVKEICDDYFGVDFYRLSADMADSLEVPLNFVYNSEYGDTLQLAYMIQRGKSTIVQECVECNSLNGYNNSTSFPEGGISYREKMDSTVNKFLDHHYPDVKKGGDNNKPKEFKAWDDQVNGMNVDAFRLYLFDSMFMPSDIGDNFDEYLLSINYGFDNLIEAKIDSFKAKFPGYKLGLYEVGLNNSDEMPWYNTMLGCLYLVKFYRWAVEYNLDHDDFITTMVYKSIRSLSLSKENVKLHYYALRQMGEAIKGDTVYTVNTSISGVYGFGTEYGLVIANDNSIDIPFAFEGYTPTSATTIYGMGMDASEITDIAVPVGAALKHNSITFFKN